MPDSSSDPIAGTDFDKLIDDATTTVDVKALSAFGYETRYRLVRLLVEADGAVRFDEITPYVSTLIPRHCNIEVSRTSCPVR